MNEGVTYLEEHPELKFGGNNSKRAVVSAFENPDSWLKSFGIEGRKQELCDGVSDVAGVIEDVEENRAADLYRTVSAHAASHHTNGQLDRIECLSCSQLTFQCQ